MDAFSREVPGNGNKTRLASNANTDLHFDLGLKEVPFQMF